MFSLDFQLTTVFSMTIVLSMITKRRGVFTATATAAMMFLAACSSGETGGSGDAASSTSNGDAAASGEGTIEIVASTSVWGDLTKAVIDDESVANVRTIITDTNVDPHHFEPTAADLARANDADVVVAGGGGYDAWLYEPLNEDIVIHALPLTPHEHNSGSEKPEGTEAHAQYYGDNNTFDVANNEHVWFDTKALSTVANGVADRILPARHAKPQRRRRSRPGLIPGTHRQRRARCPDLQPANRNGSDQAHPRSRRGQKHPDGSGRGNPAGWRELPGILPLCRR